MRMKKHLIYKKDKWNMLTIEVQGRNIVVRELSTEWGEDCRVFLGRPELLDWANKRFSPDDFAGDQAEYERVMQAIAAV